ncbi:MAG: DHH family phosphoesterase [Candidatus Bipolaricaulia bacterium]
MSGKRASIPVQPGGKRDPALEMILDLIKEHERFALTTHLSPEGDAIGSTLALRLILRRLGKEALIIMQDPVPHSLRFLKGTEGIKGPRDLPEGFDPQVWFVLDCASFERVGEQVKRLIERTGKPIVNIDHHVSNPGFGQINYLRQAAATAQLILRLASALKLSDPEVATALYAGLVADTDAFRNANTDAQALRDGAALLEQGARAHEVIVNLYERRTEGEIRLLGHTLLHAHLDGEIIWAELPLEAFAQLGALPQETERLVDELRMVEGVAVAVLFKELEGGRVKVSFRAKDGLKVNELAQSFGGGGHEQAAGCLVNGDLAGVERLILEELKRRLDAHRSR